MCFSGCLYWADTCQQRIEPEFRSHMYQRYKILNISTWINAYKVLCIVNRKTNHSHLHTHVPTVKLQVSNQDWIHVIHDLSRQGLFIKLAEQQNIMQKHCFSRQFSLNLATYAKKWITPYLRIWAYRALHSSFPPIPFFPRSCDS